MDDWIWMDIHFMNSEYKLEYYHELKPVKAWTQLLKFVYKLPVRRNERVFVFIYLLFFYCDKLKAIIILRALDKSCCTLKLKVNLETKIIILTEAYISIILYKIANASRAKRTKREPNRWRDWSVRRNKNNTKSLRRHPKNKR